MKKMARLAILAVVAVPLSWAALWPSSQGRKADVGDASAFPNPWRALEHKDKPVVIAAPAPSVVRIYTMDGGLVRTLRARDGKAAWNLRDFEGKPVSSGFYLYLVDDGNRDTAAGKLAVIR